MQQAFLLLGLPLALASIAVVAREYGRGAYWAGASVIAALFTGLWFSIAAASQAWSSFLFVVLLPVGLIFWAVSRPRSSTMAFLAGVCACLVRGLIGLFLGVNAGMVRP
jgi:hypothetical protein